MGIASGSDEIRDTLNRPLGASTAFHEELAITKSFTGRVSRLGRSEYIPSFMKRKWHQKKRYIILSLIIFPPMGIPLVWLSKWNRNVKIGASVASTILFILALAAPPEETKTANKINPEPNQSLTTDSIDIQEDDVTTTPESEVEESNAEESVEESVEPYLDITELIDQPMTELSQRFNVSLNQAGNLKYENEKYQLFVEARDGQTSSFVTFGVKELGSCKADSVLDHADQVLSRAGLDPSVKGTPTNPQGGVDMGFVEYGDYPGSIKPGTSCLDGGYYEANIRLKK